METAVKSVAYLRKEKQTFEIDYSLVEVWAAIPDVLSTLQWKAEEIDDAGHKVKIKTSPGFMSYSSRLTVEGFVIDDKKCRITVEGETPVTTITSIADFGRTSDRVALFFETLAHRMNLSKKS